MEDIHMGEKFYGKSQDYGSMALNFQTKYFGTIITNALKANYHPQDIKDFFMILEDEETKQVLIRVIKPTEPYIGPESKLEVELDGIRKTISAQLFLSLMPPPIKSEVDRYISHYSRIQTVLKRTKKEITPAPLRADLLVKNPQVKKEKSTEEDPFIGYNLSFLQGRFRENMEKFFDDLRENPSVIFTKGLDKQNRESYYVGLSHPPKTKIPLRVFIRAGGRWHCQDDDEQNFKTFEELCKQHQIKNQIRI